MRNWGFDMVKSTVCATAHILLEGNVCSNEDVFCMLKAVIEELDQDDIWVEIGLGLCWAREKDERDSVLAELAWRPLRLA